MIPGGWKTAPADISDRSRAASLRSWSTAVKPGSLHLGLGLGLVSLLLEAHPSYWGPQLPLGQAGTPPALNLSEKTMGIIMVQVRLNSTPLQRAWVQSLVRKLRSHRLPATTKTQSREINKNK